MLLFEEIARPITAADCVAKTVYICDLPYDTFQDSFRTPLSVYGDVHSVQYNKHKEFPAICTGTHISSVYAIDPASSIIYIFGFDCHVWYPGQPIYLSQIWSSTSGLSALRPVLALRAAWTLGPGGYLRLISSSSGFV